MAEEIVWNSRRAYRKKTHNKMLLLFVIVDT
jgi:hypothetical protein